jgi:hypothetical protein
MALGRSRHGLPMNKRKGQAKNISARRHAVTRVNRRKVHGKAKA